MLHFYKDVRMVWAYLGGSLRLCPLDFAETADTARGLRETPAETGLAAADVAALLALDPFSGGAATAVLPGDRFTLMERLEYGHGATLVKQISTTRDTKQQTTRQRSAPTPPPGTPGRSSRPSAWAGPRPPVTPSPTPPAATSRTR